MLSPGKGTPTRQSRVAVFAFCSVRRARRKARWCRTSHSDAKFYHLIN
jgi:hypothetical protein